MNGYFNGCISVINVRWLLNVIVMFIIKGGFINCLGWRVITNVCFSKFYSGVVKQSTLFSCAMDCMS